VTADGVSAPYPFLPPGDQGAPIYAITNGTFLVDATSGQVNPQSLNATTTAEALETLANQVQKVITQTQTAAASQHKKARTAGTMTATADSGGGTFTMDEMLMATNKLWLQITGVSNGIKFRCRKP